MNNENNFLQKPQLNYREMSQAELAAHCEKQDKAIAELTQNMNRLMEMIRLSTHKQYGASGDSVSYPEGDQLSFFNEAETAAQQGALEPTFEEVTAKTPRKPKRKGKREQDFKDLKVTVINHELPAEQQVCPVCANPLHNMKVEVTRTLKLVPAHFEVEEHRRHVYACRECEKNQSEGDKLPFVSADMPNLPIPGSFATPELIAGIINSKYTNAMPLARIEREFDRMDSVQISRQNMSNWILQCSEEYFSRIYSHMREHWSDYKLQSSKKSMSVLKDIMEHGFVTTSLQTKIERTPPYTLLPNWSRTILDNYLSTLTCAYGTLYLTQIRNACSRFFLFLEFAGISQPSEITHDIVKSFFIKDIHISAKAKDQCNKDIRHCLLYMAPCVRIVDVKTDGKYPNTGGETIT